MYSCNGGLDRHFNDNCFSKIIMTVPGQDNKEERHKGEEKKQGGISQDRKK
jgi:hypothetical protein